MKMRAIAIFAISVLVAQLATGCRTTDEKKLPEDRKVRTVTFPVRPLKFADVRCIQQLEHWELSGALVNVSTTPLSKVRIEAKLFLAEQEYGEPFNVPVTPSLLQPGEMGIFSLSGNVKDPVSHVELHVRWEMFIPSGF